MDQVKTIQGTLLAQGWKENSVADKPALQLRMTYRKSGHHVKLDLRAKSNELWLWLIGETDWRCLSLHGKQPMAIIEAIISMQDELKFEDYLTNYMSLQSHCDVSIVSWEQYSDAFANFLEPDLDDQIEKAQRALLDLDSGAVDDADPIVFPGGSVQRLSDYVRILKRMQTGDLQGALSASGLDLVEWGQVAQAWGACLTRDPTLTAKFHRLLQGGSTNDSRPTEGYKA